MIAFAAVLALAASGVVAYRVLAPAETANPVIRRLPNVTQPHAKVYGRYAQAPLIVESRLRVFVARRQVRADGPVDAWSQRTPAWSFRRWPEQVTGVVTVGPTVVSRWSDGLLVALDSHTGREVWRLAAPVGPTEFSGRRTGAQTVYAPVGLHTIGSTVMVLGGGALVAVDGGTGKVRWQAQVGDDCATGFTTSSGRFMCASGVAYVVQSGVPENTGLTGPVAGLGCVVARSACTGLTDGAGHGWLTTTVKPVRSKALDPPGAALDVTGRLALATSGGEVVATDAATGTLRWRWRAAYGQTVKVVAVQPGLVHVLTSVNTLVNVASTTGQPVSSMPLRPGKDSLRFALGYTYAVDGFVVAERLKPGAKPEDVDAAYYYGEETVVIAGTKVAPPVS